MGKKKTGTDAGGEGKVKRNRKAINLDELRVLIGNGNSAKSIMQEMGIAQPGSLRNAVFMLSQKDEAFYTVPGLVDETRFKPALKVGKAGIRISAEKLPFMQGTTASYETRSNGDGTAIVIISGQSKGGTVESASAE
jgi:hypothetical protein